MSNNVADFNDDVANGGHSFNEMPNNYEAEQGLIGMLLVNNEYAHEVDEFLQPEHFFTPVHGKIFEAIITLIDRGQVANPVTLKNYFENEEVLKPVGGANYLSELAKEVPLLNNVKDYANTIHERFLSRSLISACQDTASKAFKANIEVSPFDIIESHELQLFNLAENSFRQTEAVSFRDSLLSAISLAEIAFNREGGLSGVTTGLFGLDKKLGGLNATDLIILAGRPSMGKTALATNIAFNAAKKYQDTNGSEGGRVAIFSLEMGHVQLTTRILADRAGISSDAIRKGDIDKRDFQKFAEVFEEIANLPIHTDDTTSLTISGLKSRARKMKRKFGIDLIIVDYLQLLEGSKHSISNRVQEISEITRGLKAIAKDLNVPVLALSQLSRNVESREDKRPQLSDLRDSGSIEQDADAVLFMYREEYYLGREEPSQKAGEDASKFAERHANWQEAYTATQNISEVIVGKQRHGPIGTVKLYFDPAATKFTDLQEF